MFIKLKGRLLGTHAYVRVFSGPDSEHLGFCGKLIFTAEEWAELISTEEVCSAGIRLLIEDDKNDN